MSLRARDLTLATDLRISCLIEVAEQAIVNGKYLWAASKFHEARNVMLQAGIADGELCEMLAYRAAQASARFQQEARELA